MQIVPIQPLPAQTFRVILDSQFTSLTVRQLDSGLYMSIDLDVAPVLRNVVCENLNRIVRNVYFGFRGDFVFYDTGGADDPEYTGLGSRFLLLYLEEVDLINVAR